MSGPENTFIQSVHRHLPVGLYRMKNHNQYNGGIPDVWYSGPAADLWIEFKFVVLPKHDDTLITPNLSALQVDWLTSRSEEGRKVGVIVGTREGGVWFPDLTWATPLKNVDFRKQTRPRSDLAGAIAEIIS